MTHAMQIVIEHDKDGYFAYVPGMKGCHSQGVTMAEAMKNIREAMELYMETLSGAEVKRLMKKEVFTTSMQVSVG